MLFARLAYPFPESSRPAQLVFGVPEGSPSIGFIAYHLGLPVTDFRYFGGSPTLQLDWNDPWYSRFDNRNLRRQYDAPLSVFLYVEAFEVRREIIVRPRDLQAWVDLGLEGKSVIPVENQEELKQRVVAFLEDKNPVTVDGRPLPMKLDRIHFVRRTLKRTGVISPPEPLEVNAATLGIVSYGAIDGLPKRAAVKWELFNERIAKVPAVATDEAGGLPGLLTPDDPVLVWENFLKRPSSRAMVEVSAPAAAGWPRLPFVTMVALLGLVVVVRRRRRASVSLLAPAPLALAAIAVAGWFLPLGEELSDETTGEVLSGLLHNTYRSFDRREESVVYDRLARSIDGELLADVYLQVRKSMELESQGGARVKVDTVELGEFTREPAPGGDGFSSTCSWTVTGSVGHWGHLHTRANRYRANLTVEPRDGAWKITGLELLEESRES